MELISHFLDFSPYLSFRFHCFIVCFLPSKPSSYVYHYFLLQFETFGLGNRYLNLTSVLWPPHVKSWLIGKDSDAGRDWGQEEKGKTEDEMAWWHHWLDGYESEWTLGVGDGQGGLACCDSWGHKESDTIEWLNWTEPQFKKPNI